jgi:hypothetical protein
VRDWSSDVCSSDLGWHPTKSVENIVSDIHGWLDKNLDRLKNIFE